MDGHYPIGMKTISPEAYMYETVVKAQEASQRVFDKAVEKAKRASEEILDDTKKKCEAMIDDAGKQALAARMRWVNRVIVMIALAYMLGVVTGIVIHVIH